ncbi:magnesium chelatase [Paenibacillus rhizosphaerae]|uniref:Magnesium chelatase n=1 Tax=Paenibacillus rhizosphaerae TaxID=297318 RepID=A0A1R1EAK2_9BACL|nr:MoxR family ATPase [Paenibacillus rhizosphaerae]OMF48762.1 magnesium chelatase [Paenibacillus rhizosphaerae]
MSTPSVFHDDVAPELLNRVLSRVGSVIVGKEKEIRLALISMLSGGHILLEDVPGVGKTMLVRAIAACLGCTFGRIQFTYDLMPGDVTGTSIYHPHSGSFEFRPGPVLSNIVLADEINRASPRTQSALLEAMEERKVTVDGTTYPLPRPFLLLATQNPLHFEGTYRLPEAQMDRFMMRLSLGYPEPAQEVELLTRMQLEHPLDAIKPVMLAEEMANMQRAVRGVFVDESIKLALVQVADASRRHPNVQLGISPRGTLAWMNASQASAYMAGRSYVIPDDIKDTAVPVLAHRLMLNHAALLAGAGGEELVRELLQQLVLPVHSRKGGRL